MLKEMLYIFAMVLLFRKRQCGPGVRALALRYGDLGFKTRSDHSLNGPFPSCCLSRIRNESDLHKNMQLISI